MLASGAQLRWRIVMILVLLGAVAVPLRRALLEVANETITRGTIQEDLNRLVSSNGIVSRQVSVGKDTITISLISTRHVPDSVVNELRGDLERRTGRDVQISVETVASTRDVAALMERLARPAPVAPPVTSFAQMQQDLLNRVGPAIQEIWPATDAPLQGYDVTVGTAGTTINVHYQAANDLGDVPIGMVQRDLRMKLDLPDLALKADRVSAPPPPTPPRAKTRK
jgi:hypothetical protein